MLVIIVMVCINVQESSVLHRISFKQGEKKKTKTIIISKTYEPHELSV